jgi:hypothetical protein
MARTKAEVRRTKKDESESSSEEVRTVKRRTTQKVAPKTEINFFDALNAHAYDMLCDQVCATIDKYWGVAIEPDDLKSKLPLTTTGKRVAPARVTKTSDAPEPTEGCIRTILSTKKRCGRKPDDDKGQGILCKRCSTSKDAGTYLNGTASSTPTGSAKATGKKVAPNPTSGKTVFKSAPNNEKLLKQLVHLPIEGYKYVYMVTNSPGYLIMKFSGTFRYLGIIDNEYEKIEPMGKDYKKIESVSSVLGQNYRDSVGKKLKESPNYDEIVKIINENWKDWDEQPAVKTKSPPPKKKIIEVDDVSDEDESSSEINKKTKPQPKSKPAPKKDDSSSEDDDKESPTPLKAPPKPKSKKIDNSEEENSASVSKSKQAKDESSNESNEASDSGVDEDDDEATIKPKAKVLPESSEEEDESQSE